MGVGDLDRVARGIVRERGGAFAVVATDGTSVDVVGIGGGISRGVSVGEFLAEVVVGGADPGCDGAAGAEGLGVGPQSRVGRVDGLGFGDGGAHAGAGDGDRLGEGPLVGVVAGGGDAGAGGAGGAVSLGLGGDVEVVVVGVRGDGQVGQATGAGLGGGAGLAGQVGPFRLVAAGGGEGVGTGGVVDGLGVAGAAAAVSEGMSESVCRLAPP